ncbi:signal transducer and activator of transcription (STAT) family protein [Tieghemostelium lacteum]|uniref:Signal transducer and activator of transcription n=1 Tax=Tieghemostelium lacteum TaxID=361077 RepID=A0A152A131_TIELA|nr:signal transducer and activator of transcription (STAT) family protein [Tieghemostelium lacteum]|eukprot:KYQ99913.1 signal transducer and activator of transcription (STAT) family protein [Tieghemostelium lacteum]
MSSDFSMDPDFEDFDQNTNISTRDLFEGSSRAPLNASINTTIQSLGIYPNGFGMDQQQQQHHQQQQPQQQQQYYNLQQMGGQNQNNGNDIYVGRSNNGNLNNRQLPNQINQQQQQPQQQQQQQYNMTGSQSPLHVSTNQTPSSPLSSPLPSPTPFRNGMNNSGPQINTSGVQIHHQPQQQMQQPQQQQQQQSQMSSPQPILDTIYKLLSEQEQTLVQMIHEQSILLNRLPPNLDEQSIQSLKNLSQKQITLSNQMNTEMSALDATKKGMILEPTDLAKLFALKQDLHIQFKQLSLLHNEIQAILNPQHATTKPNVALVLKSQPFPVVISKGKQLGENQLVVLILTGARSNFHINGPVKATLVCDSHPTNKNNPSTPLEMDSQPIYPATLTAHFPLKFMAGTRKCSVNLKFGVNIRDMDNVTTTVESDASNPFVVITNECQWEGSAGVLLKKDAFDGQLEISWPQFVNTLQRHFLIATKQDPVRPKRPLSAFDFKYIQTHFFGNRPIIHQQDFDKFWSWFGKSMQTLRYQRHISSLWQEGIIYGYMGRQEVNDALSNQDPGTFIIRFSERNPGQFGIAYIGVELPLRIKHYLVQPNDTAAAKKTFPDFLSEHSQFVNLLQWTKDQNGNPRFLKSHKDTALGSFAPKKSQPPPIGGYEPLSS